MVSRPNHFLIICSYASENLGALQRMARHVYETYSDFEARLRNLLRGLLKLLQWVRLLRLRLLRLQQLLLRLRLRVELRLLLPIEASWRPPGSF